MNFYHRGGILSIESLERKAFRAWPALETLQDYGWVQRFAAGYTKRANSINALAPDSKFTPDVKIALEAPYRARGLPPVWRLTTLAPPETHAVLAAAGYRRVDESFIQEAPIDGRFAPNPEVHIATLPSPAWLAGFAEQRPVAPAHRETMARMLTSIAAPVGFASVEDAEGPMAFALGVADGEHVGVFDVLVAPRARRRGLARRLTCSIVAWGKTHGARLAYLQVVATNEAALPLYRSLGFATVYSYSYRVP